MILFILLGKNRVFVPKTEKRLLVEIRLLFFNFLLFDLSDNFRRIMLRLRHFLNSIDSLVLLLLLFKFLHKAVLLVESVKEG